MATNYEYFINNREALTELLLSSNDWMNYIDGMYCKEICPYSKNSKCSLGPDDCNAPHSLKERVEMWLDKEA